MPGQMTYTHCELCEGTCCIPPDAEDRLYTKECPCTKSSTPGWSPTGVTARQLERLVAEHDTLERMSRPSIPWSVALELLRGLRDKRSGDMVPQPKSEDAS